MPTVRLPAVAGRFYPRDSETLREEVSSYLAQSPSHDVVHALGCVVPHAGYMYSGHVAGAVFARLEIPAHCILMCPNHTGMGQPLAIMSEGDWETPLGNVSIDSSIAAMLKQRFPLLHEDSAAHRAEHAAEGELPFLQLRQPDLGFGPVTLGARQVSALAQTGNPTSR